MTGMRVEPPTSTTSSMSFSVSLASSAPVGTVPPSLGQIVGQLLELGPGDGLDQVLWAVLVRRDEGQIDLRLHHAGQLDFWPSRPPPAIAAEPACPCADRCLLPAGTLGHPVHDPAVVIVAAQMSVTGGGLYLEDAVTDLEHRDIECAAAQVEYQNGLSALLVQPIGQCGRGGLVDDAQYLETGYLAGVLGGLALLVVEIGGDRDHGLGDRLTEILLGIRS